MSKRLHDTDCWKKEWFRHLTVTSKILWLYILDTCDCAGIWEKDLEMASFLTALQITGEDLNSLSKQLRQIDEKRFLVLDFIDFQYGLLSDSSKMKKPVFQILAKFNLKYPIDTVSGFQDTVKDKDKDKDKDKEKDKKPPTIQQVEAYFSEKGYTLEAAKKFHEYYSAANWHDSEGKPVKSWKQKAIVVWFKDENKVQRKAAAFGEKLS